MSQWSEGQIHANGITLHYYRTGGNKPPLVLLHGFTDNGLCWTHVARGLENEYDIIMPDARGHGLSEGLTNGFSTELMADDTAELIQALHLERPLLMGHSMGASTSAQIAATYPDLVKAVALEDPPWHEWQDDQGKFNEKPREERIGILRKEHPSWADDVLGPMADAKAQFNTQVLNFRRFAPSWRDVVPKIQCPMLLITADPQRGAIIHPEDAEEMKKVWHDARMVRINEVGHMIHFEQYDQFMNAVKKFFSSLN